MQSPNSKEETETEIKKTNENKIPKNQKTDEDPQHIRNLKLDKKDSGQVTSDYYFG